MNGLGTSLLWGAVQVSLFSLAGGIVYVVARRRGPRAGSLAALTAVLLIFAVSLSALCPQSRWWTLQAPISFAAAMNPTEEPVPDSSESGGKSAVAQNQQVKAPVSSQVQTPALDTRALLKAAWAGILEGLQTQPHAVRDDGWRWPAFVAWLLFAGMSLGLLRLFLGLAAVARYRRYSSLLDDSELADMLAIVCAELGCNRPVAVHESAVLDSPAVVGWLRPLVLLPENWRGWTQDELRAVLAHEVAHVSHRDYVGWVLAQVSLVVNFYNPLVHWLVGRLRIEQELAADGSGARAAGGRETYLTILAGMALRQDNRRASWAARPFLPARGTFLRRIEMLRDSKSVDQPQLALRSRVLVLGALTIAALVAAGMGAPLSGETLDLGFKKQPQAKSDKTLTGEYLPPGAIAAVAVRVPDVLRLLGSDELRALLDETPPLKKMGVSIKDLDEIKFGVLDMPPGGAPPAYQLYVRSLKPMDWFAALRKVGPELQQAELNGVKYLTAGDISVFMPDDRSIVGGPDARIRDLIQTGGRSARPAWADGWDKVSSGPVVAMLNVNVFGRILDTVATQQLNSPLAAWAPLWQNSRIVLLNVNLDKKLAIHAISESADAEGAKKVFKNLQAAATFCENLLDGFSRTVAQAQGPDKAAVTELISLGKDLLGHVQITEQGNLVDVQIQTEKFGPNTVTGLLLPAVMRVRQAASRNVSQNNLKQIGLAMHNYNATFNHFPPAVVMGPDGKTPHSWRIELLPFLEQNQLYQAYKMDEPWDSANNRKVLEKMPRVFKADQDDKSNASSYYALTGKDTVFAGKEGTKFAEITDGLSNTIMVVEAKRDIPWTKPEDIEYAADKPLPKFGGYFPQGFNALICDGSVRFFPQSIAEKLMRGLITKSGGEILTDF